MLERKSARRTRGGFARTLARGRADHGPSCNEQLLEIGVVARDLDRRAADYDSRARQIACRPRALHACERVTRRILGGLHRAPALVPCLLSHRANVMVRNLEPIQPPARLEDGSRGRGNQARASPMNAFSGDGSSRGELVCEVHRARTLRRRLPPWAGRRSLRRPMR